MNILIIAPNWIGDAVAAQPLFMRLRQAYPQAQIDALAPPWVAPLLEAMPEIQTVIATPFAHGKLHFIERYRLARQLARQKYAQAYVLPNSLKSALIPFLAGIPKRVGFVGEFRYGLLNVAHKLDRAALPRQVDRYTKLAQPPETALQLPLPHPHLVADAAHSVQTLADLNLAAIPAPIIFCPGAEFGPAKRWPVEHFAELARQLLAENIPVWLLGSHKDEPVGTAIATLAPGTINLCGKTGLAQAIHLLAQARAVVTNDSGLMHVAAALGRPQVALFGSSSPNYTPPLSPQAQIMWQALACSPCFQRECPLGHFKCLREIYPAQVMERLKSMR